MPDISSVVAGSLTTSRPASGNTAPESNADRDARLHAVATEYEAAFLAEMLKYTGIGKVPEGFGGGAGEDAFGSMLVQEYAGVIARNGGIGLAESIVASLAAREEQ